MQNNTVYKIKVLNYPSKYKSQWLKNDYKLAIEGKLTINDKHIEIYYPIKTIKIDKLINCKRESGLAARFKITFMLDNKVKDLIFYPKGIFSNSTAILADLNKFL